MAINYDELMQAITSLVCEDIVPIAPSASTIIDTSRVEYHGVLSQDQFGSIPVYGTIFGDVRVDGLGLVTEVMLSDSEDGTLTDGEASDLQVLLASFQYGP